MVSLREVGTLCWREEVAGAAEGRRVAFGAPASGARVARPCGSLS